MTDFQEREFWGRSGLVRLALTDLAHLRLRVQRFSSRGARHDNFSFDGCG